MTRKERKKRAEQKVRSYAEQIRASMQKALEEGNNTKRSIYVAECYCQQLIKGNPQEHHLIIQGAKHFQDRFLERIKTLKRGTP